MTLAWPPNCFVTCWFSFAAVSSQQQSPLLFAFPLGLKVLTHGSRSRSRPAPARPRAHPGPRPRHRRPPRRHRRPPLRHAPLLHHPRLRRRTPCPRPHLLRSRPLPAPVVPPCPAPSGRPSLSEGPDWQAGVSSAAAIVR